MNTLEVMAEFTQIQQGFSLISRAKDYSFYTHSLIGGYTHQGQVLGAGIGPGGNLQTAGLTYRNQLQALGFHLERYVHNNDLFYTRLPYLWLGGDQYHLDATKHWVDVSGTISYSDSYGPWLFEAKLQGVQTYNFNWRYAPDGVPWGFPFPGHEYVPFQCLCEEFVPVLRRVIWNQSPASRFESAGSSGAPVLGPSPNSRYTTTHGLGLSHSGILKPIKLEGFCNPTYRCGPRYEAAANTLLTKGMPRYATRM